MSWFSGRHFQTGSSKKEGPHRLGNQISTWISIQWPKEEFSNGKLLIKMKENVCFYINLKIFVTYRRPSYAVFLSRLRVYANKKMMQFCLDRYSNENSLEVFFWSISVDNIEGKKPIFWLYQMKMHYIFISWLQAHTPLSFFVRFKKPDHDSEKRTFLWLTICRKRANLTW